MNQNAVLSGEDVSRRIAEIQTALQKNLSPLERDLLGRELGWWLEEAMSFTDSADAIKRGGAEDV